MVSVRALNEELKNPHLVETLIHVIPSTGKLIETADPRPETLTKVLQQKLSGQIPVYDVAFNVSGIPLLLTRQSYLQLRLKPVFYSTVSINSFFHSVPSVFEFNRALWPKKNVACIESASAVLSNFAAENQTPVILPYIRSLHQNVALSRNHPRTWNPSYLTNAMGSQEYGNASRFVYGNRFLNLPINGTFEQPQSASPYSVSLEPQGNNNFIWYGNDLLIQIPLEEVLPVFQIPVIPLKQTNSSSIQLRLRLLSPRHMFFSAGYLNPASAGAIINESAEVSSTSSEANNINAIQLGTVEVDWKREELQNAVLGGGTLKWLKAITNTPFATVNSLDMFNVDFTVECELVLRALTTPLLNPLTYRFIEPFINESNEFTAHYQDSYVFSQTLNPLNVARMHFSFTPTQLFYNTTHIALLFMQSPKDSNPSKTELPSSLSGPVPVGLASSLFKHGHFFLDKSYSIDDVMITLGPSQTCLFDHPLDFSELFSITEETLKRYDPTEMSSDMLFIQNRFAEGDAIFLFDLSHARDSGFFIDVDNMIRVSGTVNKREGLPTFKQANPGNTNQVFPGVNNNVVNQARSISLLRDISYNTPELRDISYSTPGSTSQTWEEGFLDISPNLVALRLKYGKWIDQAFKENFDTIKEIYIRGEGTVDGTVNYTYFDSDQERNIETAGSFRFVIQNGILSYSIELNLGVKSGQIMGDQLTKLFAESVSSSLPSPTGTRNIIPDSQNVPNNLSASALNDSQPYNQASTNQASTLGVQTTKQGSLTKQPEDPQICLADSQPCLKKNERSTTLVPSINLSPGALGQIAKNDNPITVMMVLIYQNTFSVLLEADGLVLIQQQ